MKKNGKAICLLLSIMMFLAAATACSQAKKQAGDSDEPVIAKVNEKEIFLSQYQKQKNILSEFFGEDTSEEMQKQISDSIVSSLIENEVVNQKAQEMKLAEFSEEEKQQLRDSYLNERRTALSGEIEVSDDLETADIDALVEEKLQEELKEQGLDDEEALTDFVIGQAVYQRVYDKVTQEIEVPDDEAKNYYDQELVKQKQTEEENHEQALADFFNYANTVTVYVPEGIRYVKHIFVSFAAEDLEEIAQLAQEGEETEEKEQEALEKIFPKMEEISDKLKQGADFDQMIAEYGQDEGMESGDYPNGYPIAEGISEKAGFPEAWLAAAFRLESPGDFSSIVVMSDGCSILQYVEDIPAGQVPYEDVKQDIIETIRGEKQEEVWRETIEQWKTELNVEIFEENIK